MKKKVIKEQKQQNIDIMAVVMVEEEGVVVAGVRMKAGGG